MGFLQETHLDPGKTRDSSLGILYIHTFRKLPTIKPNIKISAIVIFYLSNPAP
jgi:hypothetical protein